MKLQQKIDKLFEQSAIPRFKKGDRAIIKGWSSIPDQEVEIRKGPAPLAYNGGQGWLVKNIGGQNYGKTYWVKETDIILPESRGITKKATYVGNCTNTFDKDTGESNLNIFTDVSDFASKDEQAIELEKKDFAVYAEIPKELKKQLQGHSLEYKFYDGNIYVIYDNTEDIHYFFH